MFVTIEEDRKTFEYQETMNVYAENISSKKQTFWRPIYKVIDNSYFSATKIFPT